MLVVLFVWAKLWACLVVVLVSIDGYSWFWNATIFRVRSDRRRARFSVISRLIAEIGLEPAVTVEP